MSKFKRGDQVWVILDHIPHEGTVINEKCRGGVLIDVKNQDEPTWMEHGDWRLMPGEWSLLTVCQVMRDSTRPSVDQVREWLQRDEEDLAEAEPVECLSLEDFKRMMGTPKGDK